MSNASPLCLVLSCLLAAACSSSSPTPTPDSGEKHDSSAKPDAGHDSGHDSGHASGHDAGSDVTTTEGGPSTPDTGTDKDTGVDAGSDAMDAGDAYDGPVFTLEAGVTWTALYRDYFGPTGVATCSKSTICHGSSIGSGFAASGFLCPRTDGGLETCYHSMTSDDASAADLVTPDASFTNDNLGAVLCYAANPTGGGSMPYSPNGTPCAYTFTPTDIQRISDWIAAGAPND